jgi:hypothetical protein
MVFLIPAFAEFVMAAASLAFLVSLVASMLLSRKPDARVKFPLSLGIYQK